MASGERPTEDRFVAFDAIAPPDWRNVSKDRPRRTWYGGGPVVSARGRERPSPPPGPPTPRSWARWLRPPHRLRRPRPVAGPVEGAGRGRGEDGEGAAAPPPGDGGGWWPGPVPGGSRG